jgi:hypothetical protein
MRDTPDSSLFARSTNPWPRMGGRTERFTQWPFLPRFSVCGRFNLVRPAKARQRWEPGEEGRIPSLCSPPLMGPTRNAIRTRVPPL